MIKGKKLLIFDCDGVLFNSHDANISYFNVCMSESGYEPVPEELHERITYMSVKQLVYEMTDDPAERQRIINICKGVNYDPFLDQLKPLFDFNAVFSKLEEQYKLAIASNRGVSLPRVIQHYKLDRHFAFFVSTMEAKAKPHPDMLYRCLDHFKEKNEDVIYIGDSISDYKAAGNAGIDFIWVGNNDYENNIDSVEDLLFHIS